MLITRGMLTVQQEIAKPGIGVDAWRHYRTPKTQARGIWRVKTIGGIRVCATHFVSPNGPNQRSGSFPLVHVGRC
jgi:hypothetical protein